MKKNKFIEFANLVCHFDNYKLLDKFADVVHPAFFHNYTRTFKDSTYFFYENRLEKVKYLEEDRYFIYGRIVKDTNIEREQVFCDGKLIDDYENLQNSPSSFFALSLIDHRLFFMKEHKDSPTLSSFKVTLESFMIQAIDNLVSSEYEDYAQNRDFYAATGKKITKKSLRLKHPKPEIELIPLSSAEGLKEFINSLSSIDRFTLDLVKPNDEGDCNDFFEKWRDKANKDLQTPKSKLIFNKHRKSLPHNEIESFANEARLDGNIIINITGKDKSRDTIRGTPEEFQLTVPIEEEFDTPKNLVSMMYYKFWELIKGGLVEEPRITDIEDVKVKIENQVALTKKFGD